jgi:CheY-like chemotaxis protein
MTVQRRTKQLLEELGLSGARLERYQKAVDRIQDNSELKRVHEGLANAVRSAPEALQSVRELLKKRQRPHVFIVHPNDIELRKLAQSMAASFFDVQTMHTAEEALAAAATTRADVVVCSLALPQMDGLTLVRRLRAIDREMLVMVLAQTSEEFGRAAAHRMAALHQTQAELVLSTALKSALQERDLTHAGVGWTSDFDDLSEFDEAADVMNEDRDAVDDDDQKISSRPSSS